MRIVQVAMAPLFDGKLEQCAGSNASNDRCSGPSWSTQDDPFDEFRVGPGSLVLCFYIHCVDEILYPDVSNYTTLFMLTCGVNREISTSRMKNTVWTTNDFPLPGLPLI